MRRIPWRDVAGGLLAAGLLAAGMAAAGADVDINGPTASFNSDNNTCPG